MKHITGIQYNILKHTKNSKNVTQKSIKQYKQIKNTIIADDITNSF
jgi:hypothetical protein